MVLVLNQLPSLASLELVNVNAVGETHPLCLELVVSQHLDDLCIIVLDELSPKSFLRILSLFSSVDALSLIGADMEGILMDDNMAGWPLPQYALKRLEILDDSPLSELFSTMMLSPSLLQSVESLKMEGLGWANVDAFEHLIAQVGSSLLYFEPPD
ncbi:hypothetical protein PHLCEN_2v10239, partial [Hermanssonia centrifuga]